MRIRSAPVLECGPELGARSRRAVCIVAVCAFTQCRAAVAAAEGVRERPFRLAQPVRFSTKYELVRRGPEVWLRICTLLVGQGRLYACLQVTLEDLGKGMCRLSVEALGQRAARPGPAGSAFRERAAEQTQARPSRRSSASRPRCMAGPASHGAPARSSCPDAGWHCRAARCAPGQAQGPRACRFRTACLCRSTRCISTVTGCTRPRAC